MGEHFERKDMNVLLVADNHVNYAGIYGGIGNIFNLFRAYQALTSPGRPKLKSVIPILRIKTDNEASGMVKEFKKWVESEMNKATNNAVTKGEGFCDYEAQEWGDKLARNGKLVHWM